MSEAPAEDKGAPQAEGQQAPQPEDLQALHAEGQQAPQPEDQQAPHAEGQQAPQPEDLQALFAEGQQAPQPEDQQALLAQGQLAPWASNEEAPAPSRLKRLSRIAEPFLPWVSLVLSIWGAISMDRSESQGGIVAMGAVFSFFGLLVLSLLSRPSRAEKASKLTELVRFASFATSQSLVQLSLFFSAPFYAAASAWTVPQGVFALWFVSAAWVVTWDPLARRVLEHPLAGPGLTAFASFVGANAALPMLGVPHRQATFIASLGVGLFMPVLAVVRGQPTRERLGALVIGIATPMIVFLGGARALPPAPLNLVDAKLGTHVENRELVGAAARFDHAPPELICWTAIHAPLGLADALTHEWQHDGEPVLRIPLSLRGGRKQGFRTWSRLKLRPNAKGIYRCDVVTSLGQPLGGTAVVIGK